MTVLLTCVCFFWVRRPYRPPISAGRLEKLTVYAMRPEGAERKTVTDPRELRRVADLFGRMESCGTLVRGQTGIEGTFYHFVFQTKDGGEFRAVWYPGARGGYYGDSTHQLLVKPMDLHGLWDSLEPPGEFVAYSDALEEITLPQLRAGVAVGMTSEDIEVMIRRIESQLPDGGADSRTTRE